jgi:hypothetical protein
MAAVMLIFEPLFLSYSIVPHSDIFAVALGLATLYLVFSKTSKVSYVLSLTLFYVVSLTRPEFFVVFLFPILLFYLLKLLKEFSIRAMIKSVFFLSLFVLPALWVSVEYSYVTRFDIIEKFTLFLKPDLLNLTLENLFTLYDNTFLNLVFLAFIMLGFGWALLHTLANFVTVKKRGKSLAVKRKSGTSIRAVLLSNQVIIAFCLFSLFIIHIIILTVYGYGYVIVDGNLIIKTSLPVRYLILSRLLLCYPLAYVLSMIIRVFCAEVIHKQ